ncbi:hypothetical protein BG32_03085 [Mesotoga sp. HF07.pep.5.2.highcov]|nr:hypothetical protein BG32_03085 [Mesotoga sp. HF07.pep.5.2.highcov]
MIIPKRIDSVIPTKLQVGIRMLLLHDLTKNEEQILALERSTSFLFGERRTAQRSTSFSCSSYHEPATPNPGLSSFPSSLSNRPAALLVNGEQPDG